MLNVDNVNAYYGKLQVLHDLSLKIDDGERVGIFGHNGAGKTTLLKSCVGDMAHMTGRIEYGDRRVVPGQVHLNVRAGIAFVPQGHNVFRDLTVEQNLRISGLLHDPAYSETVCRIFPVLGQRKRHLAGSMSGGQQQMLALGMGLMTRPSLLLLDEPTTGLAPIIVKDVLECIRRVNQDEGTTVVIVEQNVQAALKQVERALVIKSGRIIFDGPSQQLLQEESLWHLF
ncbi:ABC transporter ATP-binding protein [Paralcaligenes ureilyticus]|uniref:Branched-chain amino acid transport system ATP-binding protein n=1 Tax=Paralcaligenes ureilyticus TaxID=627131 RepID=A0A4R3LU45_9BURK|nr:ABC transporter ATP-binding protein [Paralcaligenes ureilyticus]TCT04053.1 branched-chain amino acid transport system ATP-binding protein [Paralcaligenes ureilyticus]